MSDLDKLFKIDMKFENRNARISRKVSQLREKKLERGETCYGSNVIKKKKKNDEIPQT